MLDQNIFTETIREVSEIMKTSEEGLSREEILKYFDSMELNETQQNMVLDYLLKPQEENEEETEESGEEIEDEIETETEVPAGDKTNKLPNSPVFQMYLEEISRLTVCTDEELEDLYEDLLDGKAEAIQKISDSWMMRILEHAKELPIAEEDFSDVIQEGNMALFIKLSELCDSGNPVDVDAVLEETVLNGMKAYIQELTGEDDVENAMVGKATLVNEARKYLMEENGQEPSVGELAAYTRMSEKELSDILDMIQKAEKK